MPTDRSAQRVASFALGTAAIFDLTGAVIYRMLRSSLPAPPPPGPVTGPVLQSARVIGEAHREALVRAHGGERGPGVSR